MMDKALSNVKLALAATALAALAACSADPVPKDTFYRLETAGISAMPAGKLGGTVEVPPLRADGVYNERPIIYRSGASQLQQYTYHYWAEPPTAMLQRNLVAALRTSGAFDLVVTPEMRSNRDYEIVGTLRRLEHVVSGNSRVVVEMELGLRRLRGNETLLVETYTAERPAGRGVASAVDGIQGALDDILGRFIADAAAFGS